MASYNHVGTRWLETKMGEAASQAAAVRTAEYDALEALRLDWGAYYRIGYDESAAGGLPGTPRSGAY